MISSAFPKKLGKNFHKNKLFSLRTAGKCKKKLPAFPKKLGKNFHKNKLFSLRTAGKCKKTSRFPQKSLAKTFIKISYLVCEQPENAKKLPAFPKKLGKNFHKNKLFSLCVAGSLFQKALRKLRATL